MKPIDIQWIGRAEYAKTLALQERLVGEYLAGTGSEKLLLLEHEPVYTIGRTRDQSSLRGPKNLPHPVFEINRGGKATWHGPGQLVAYPILDLRRHGRDLHCYLRFLEEIIIGACGALGVRSHRRDGLTGVWIGPRKIASIGVGVRRWITMHGLALNVTRDSLESFRHITPCGIADVEMTCLEAESGQTIRVEETAALLARIFLRELPRDGLATGEPADLAPSDDQP